MKLVKDMEWYLQCVHLCSQKAYGKLKASVSEQRKEIDSLRHSSLELSSSESRELSPVFKVKPEETAHAIFSGFPRCQLKEEFQTASAHKVTILTTANID